MTAKKGQNTDWAVVLNVLARTLFEHRNYFTTFQQVILRDIQPPGASFCKPFILMHQGSFAGIPTTQSSG